MERAVAIATEILPGCDAAGVCVVYRGDRIDTHATSADALREVDRLQHELEEGPCLDALQQYDTVHTYNTVMAVAAGVGLLLVVDLGRRLRREEAVGVEGYAVAFAIVGALLTVTGLHMTLTWPLAPIGFPFDNIVFGEPALVFGVILLAAAVVRVWKSAVLGVPSPGQRADDAH